MAYEKLIELSSNDDCTKGNFLDYLDNQNYYKLIGMNFQDKKVLFNKLIL